MTATDLVYYQKAKTALLNVVKVDEAKEILNKASAMQTYAQRAKDLVFFNFATEIRMRAERRIGEIMEYEPKAVGTKGIIQAGMDVKAGGFSKNPPASEEAEKPISLSKQGIDKNLAHRARKFAAMSEEEFEEEIEEAVKAALKAQDRHSAKEDKKQQRADRERDLAEKTSRISLKIGRQIYNVILADPAWKFETYSENGMDRSAENHYTTAAVEEFMALDVASAAASDSVLYLWVTVPMLQQGLSLMKGWGFEYKSHLVWNKDKAGTGYWSRNRHELLLIGTRGNPPAPAPGTQPPSVIDAPVGEHSAKPLVFYEIIEGVFPNVPKLEMFARSKRDGWDSWGNEMEDG